MLRRLRGLFERYCAQNLLIERAGPALPARGEVTRIARRGNRLEVSGWTQADRVTLECGEERVSTVPRADVPPDPRGGFFALDLPVAQGALRLHLGEGGDPAIPLTGISPRAYGRARRALLPGFASRLVRAVPLVVKWMRSRDPALRPRIPRGTRLLGAAFRPTPARCAFRPC